MSKHTPGPWCVVSEGMASPKVVDANGLGICHTTYAPTGAEANARLIAAAPLLYEALQELCDTLGECGMTEKARAAIKAVEGGA